MIDLATGRLIVDIPDLRLVSLTNGGQWEKFSTATIQKKQAAAVRNRLERAALRCPFRPPLDVTIIRRSPGRMDSDNAVATAKYVRDAIARWLGISDSRDDLVRYHVTQEKTKAGVYGVRLIIKARGAA